ncbi:MAG: hypothetical protein GEU79_06735 [Acidimicrobiia bacterium]|nr:hypothetical protein [Acidimicrobiia bacterium]
MSIPRETFDTLEYRFTKLDNFQLQLCHPRPGDTPQRHFLETRGPGVYHLAFAAPDVDESERAALESGLAILEKGRRQDGSGFTYFDTEDEIGVTLNIRTPT